MQLEPGTRVGRYVIEALIGGGGMGHVYRSADSGTGVRVALKIPRMAGLSPNDTARFLARFAREATTLKSFRHPHIVELLHVSERPPTPYFTMELVPGVPALEWATAAAATAHDWLTIGEQICEALAYAHARDVIHRDIKSDNVLVTRDKNGRVHIKLIDWGLLYHAQAPQLTRSGDALGTVGAIDPAVLLGTASWAPQSDFYALGALLVRGITGEHHLLLDRETGVTDKGTANLFNAVRAITPADVYGSMALHTLLERLLESDASARPQTAAEIARALREIRAALGVRHIGRAPKPRLDALPAFKDIPFAVGESPFLTKGGVYEAALPWYDHFLASHGGSARLLDTVPSEVAKFAQQKFTPANGTMCLPWCTWARPR